MIDDSHIAHGIEWKGQDVAGWWLSEKLNGCRGEWDGQEMWTRSGTRMILPDWFSAELPECRLSGEIWAGRESFGVARNAAVHGRFSPAVKFMVFDAPGFGHYATRLAAAARSLSGSAVAACVALERADSTSQAFLRMKEIHRQGGEGLVARRADSRWLVGRTPEILKLKYEEQAQLAMLQRSQARARTRAK